MRKICNETQDREREVEMYHFRIIITSVIISQDVGSSTLLLAI